MKKTQHRSFSHRKLQLASETVRKLALVELSQVNGGSEDTDGSIDASRVGPCTYERTICGACQIS